MVAPIALTGGGEEAKEDTEGLGTSGRLTGNTSSGIRRRVPVGLSRVKRQTI